MVIENISKVDVYIGLAMNGVFTGLGCAIGTYFANNHIIEKSKKLMQRLRGK